MAETTPPAAVRSTPRWLISLVGCVTLLSASFGGISQRLETTAPGAATALWPPNAEARLIAAIERLSELERERLPPDARVIASLRTGLAMAPGDARFLSLLGVVAQRQDRPQEAERLFAHALRLAQAEQHASTQMFLILAQRGDYAGAVRYADALLRRWPTRFALIRPLLVNLFATPGGREAILERITQSPGWRGALLTALAETPATLPGLAEALLLLQERGQPPTAVELNAALDAFIAAGDVASAYRLFLLTLTESERRRAGVVFGPRLTHKPSGKRFDWIIHAGRGVETIMPADLQGGASLRFLDRPVTASPLSQTLAAAPGPYRLSVIASGHNLVAPRGVFLSLRCVGAREDLVRIPFPTGSFRTQTFAADLQIPSDGCAAQTLQIVTGLTVESWALRYDGLLTLHGVALERPS